MLTRIKKLLYSIYLGFVHHYDVKKRAGLPRYGELDPKIWDLDVGTGGELMIDGICLSDLAKQYDTPTHVVSKERLVKQYKNFLNAFKQHYPHVEVGYSYKTNPVPGVLNILHDQGAWAEVISHFELWLALHLGVKPENIIFNGPAKTPSSIELAVKNNIRLINIDNFSEITQIAETAKKYNTVQNVAVRVVTSVGWASQLGLNIKDGKAFDAFEAMQEYDSLSPVGIHFHLGTGIKDINIYTQAIREVMEFSILLNKRLGIEIQYFDFGGGFGVPTVKEHTDIDEKLLSYNYPPLLNNTKSAPLIEEYGREVFGVFSEFYSAKNENAPMVIFEPGRAITSQAQFLLLKVLAIKDGVENTKNVILDGGKNITIPLGYEDHEVFHVSGMNVEMEDGFYNLFGPLCYPEDVLYKGKKLPLLRIGDYVAIMDTGAYFIPNQMNFSNPRSAVVLVNNGEHTLIRQREKFEDIVALDNIELN